MMSRLLWLALILVAVLVALAGALIWYSIVFPRQPFNGPLPPLTSEETELSRKLREHVTAIASRPHNLDLHADLEAAASHIEATLKGLGYTPQRQEYTERGKPVRNIEVVIEPSEAKGGDVETYVVGAHYDSVGFSPGANDNGTGTAATLELARLLRDLKPREARLRLVFWVNEEYPFGKTPRMGSYIHAPALKDEGRARRRRHFAGDDRILFRRARQPEVSVAIRSHLRGSRQLRRLRRASGLAKLRASARSARFAATRLFHRSAAWRRTSFPASEVQITGPTTRWAIPASWSPTRLRSGTRSITAPRTCLRPSTTTASRA